MSLILEALRKLERDKDAPERGFVVMTHVPWARGGGGRSRVAGFGALALAVAVGALAVALWRVRAGKPAGPEGKAVATERPSVSPSAGSPGSPTPPFEARALAIESLRRSTAAAPVRPSPSVGSALPGPKPPVGRELRLNAISRQDDRPVAVLNDRLVREGDVFDDIRVIRIGETEVEVEVKGQRRILTF
jgi:hypothetical protein